MALLCLEVSLIAEDTHFCTVCEPSCLHHCSRCKSSVRISTGAVYLYTVIHFYGFLQPIFSTVFFPILNWEYIILYSVKMFSTIFQADICTWGVRGICVVPVYNCCGAGRPGDGLALWLAGPPLPCDSSLFMWQKASFSLFPASGSFYMKRNPLSGRPRLQVPCRGWRPARAAAAPAATLHWHDGMTGCMSPTQPASLFLPCPTPTPPFIFIVWIIFKPFILFVCRVFKKK